MNSFMGMVVEGIPATGKTSLINILLQNYSLQDKYPSVIKLSESHTQSLFDSYFNRGILSTDQILHSLENHIKYLENLKTQAEFSEWCNKLSTKHNLFYCFDRFHISNFVIYNLLTKEQLIKVDQKLKILNCYLILLTINEEDIKKRLIEDRIQNVLWQNYIKKLGKNISEIINYFNNLQNKYLEAYHLSFLNKLLINTSITNEIDTINLILEFLGIKSE